MDVFTRQKRSEVMAAVRPTGNRSTELVLAAALRRHGVTGWRRHLKIGLGPGKTRPDFVFPKPRAAVFVDGCFWHCCPVHGTKPATRTDFWLPKLENNWRRDRRVSATLRRHGWTVLRVWEHSVKQDLDRCVSRIRKSVSP
jgi:DNA mismatch endonuclease (patch repair protein)